MQGYVRESSYNKCCIVNYSDTGILASMTSLSFAFWKEIGQRAGLGRQITHGLEVEMAI